MGRGGGERREVPFRLQKDICNNWQLNQGLIIEAKHWMTVRSVRILPPWVWSIAKLVESHFLDRITVGFQGMSHSGKPAPKDMGVPPVALTEDLGSLKLSRGESHPAVLQICFSFGWKPNQKISWVTWVAQVEVCQIDFMSFLQAILEKYVSQRWGGWVPARWLARQCNTTIFFLTPRGSWLPSPHPALAGSSVRAFSYCYKKTIYPCVPFSPNTNHFQLNQ